MVSSIGYLKEEVAVNGQSILNINLASDIQSLSEVVVVGYGTQKRANVTGAVSSIKAFFYLYYLKQKKW